MTTKTQSNFYKALCELAKAPISIDATGYIFHNYNTHQEIIKDPARLRELADRAPSLFVGFYYLALLAEAEEINRICTRYAEDYTEAWVLYLQLFTERHPKITETIRLKFKKRYETTRRRTKKREEAPDLFSPRAVSASRPALLKSDLAALSAPEQELFWLLYEGATPAEIAEAYQIKQGTARKRIFDLRKKLSNDLQR